MIIAELERFRPLDTEEVKSRINSEFTQQRDYEEKHAIFLGGAFSEKEHFSLTLDEKTLKKSRTIRLVNCRYFTIRSTLANISLSDQEKFFIEITNCTDFNIEGISCANGRNIFFINHSSSFSITNCSCSHAEGSGIIIFNGKNFKISQCHFNDTLGAGILIIGNSSNGEIRDCCCSGCRGHFNQDAAIHLCCTSENITADDIPHRYHEALPISAKNQRPHYILIHNCNLSHCRAQGIYLEGAINCVIVKNLLVNNNKEGICFDWGSCYNIFSHNIVSLNGERKGLSTEEIRCDFIENYPLLQDGSSSMKLPGISLDNGCMNRIENNKITNNYGGGIKMIRTALFNRITDNQILYNAMGANQYVPHFHGITALGIGAINNEFNTDQPPLLDFLPSVHNTITNNRIAGHSRAILNDRFSLNNFTADNDIPKRELTPPFWQTNYSRVKAMVKRVISSLQQPRNHH